MNFDALTQLWRTAERLTGLVPRSPGELRLFKRFALWIVRVEHRLQVLTAVGYAILALVFIAFSLLVLRIQYAAATSQMRAEAIDSEFAVMFRTAQARLDSLHDEILSRTGDVASAQLLNAAKRIEDPLAGHLFPGGVALLVPGGREVMEGQLDPTTSSPGWNEERWREISSTIARRADHSKSPFSVFHGLERVYRSRQELALDKRFCGSLVYSRVWPLEGGAERARRWWALVALIPVGVCLENYFWPPSLRDAMPLYDSGSYDYLIAPSGDFIDHPTKFNVTGTADDGGPVRSATKAELLGDYPLNTRSAEFLSEAPVLNNALDTALGGEATTVAYRNLNHQLRVTTFRSVDLSDAGLDSPSIVVVTGEGLGIAEGLIAPLAPSGADSLDTLLLWSAAGLLTCFASWTAFVSKLRRLQVESRRWAHYADFEVAESLGIVGWDPAEGRSWPELRVMVIESRLRLDSRPTEIKHITGALSRLRRSLRHRGWLVADCAPCGVLAIAPVDPETRAAAANEAHTTICVIMRSLGLLPTQNSSVCIAVAFAVGGVHALQVPGEVGSLLEFGGPAYVQAMRLACRLGRTPTGFRQGMYLDVDAPAHDLHITGCMDGKLGHHECLVIPFEWEGSEFGDATKRYSEAIARWWDERKKRLEALARRRALRSNDAACHRTELARVAARLRDFRGGCHTVDDGGVILAQATPRFPRMPSLQGQDVSRKAYFTECRSKQRTVLSNRYVSATLDTAVVVLATPRYSDEGMFIGTLNAVLDLSTAPFCEMADEIVASVEARCSFRFTVGLCVIDGNKVVLGTSRVGRFHIGERLDLDAHDVHIIMKIAGTPFRVVGERNG